LKRNIFAGKRQSGGLGLNLFTNDELEEIHMATLEVLEKTGLLFDDDEALEVLDGGGATIDKNTRIAKLPPYLVEDAIRSAPSKLLLAGRNPKHDFVMESNRVGFTNFGEGVFINDPYTGEHRETTKADVASSALIRLRTGCGRRRCPSGNGATPQCRSLAAEYLQTRIYGPGQRI
jgi:trimethylamine--corrinoid protein Co-methyltransferase